ncbi:cytochrome c-551 [Paenibacillus flagellatus]|uniref:Cytochrome c-551 n=1 Tax=Paenibacillus flagellatus TaxID=2211139 RepID=A0A2V5JWZ6_9BACL|nr:cytochrome c-551 [Paenibacillus flagellatus]
MIGALLAGCGSASKDNAGAGAGAGTGTDAGNTTTVAADAEKLYKKSCVSCHGDQLEGRIGPSTNLTKVGGKLSRDQIATQIANGGNGMPGFKGKLNEAEIGSLSDWLAAKK